MSKPLDLDALAELEAAATPGPWVWADEGYNMGCGIVYTMGEGVEGGNIAAPNGDLYPRSGYSPKDDMVFIAAARNALPALIERVRELEARIDAVRALMDDWATDDSAAGWMKDRLYAALEGDV